MKQHTIGEPMQGGFYAGAFKINGELYGLIVSPKNKGEFDKFTWGKAGTEIKATSCCDGLGNTKAMAEAENETAKQILALDIDDFTDWYIPSRDELELMYRNFKPTEQENWASFRDGDNPSSELPGYPYTEHAPVQTQVELFQADNAQALHGEWYWSSTQSSAYTAWRQYFGHGCQFYGPKGNTARARAVRRFKL